MAIVERGNVVLTIPEDAVQHYIEKGYNVTDGYGNILQRAVPREVGELQKLLVEKQAEIDSLKSELEELRNQIVVDKEEVDEEEVEKKRKRGRPKKVEE